MKKEDADELLSRVLGGQSRSEDRAALSVWLESGQVDRVEAAEQLIIDGLLGVTLEKDGGERFHEELCVKLAQEEKRNFLRRLTITFHKNIRRVGFVLGPVTAVFVWFALHYLMAGSHTVEVAPGPACWAGAVLAWCVIWWIFEPIPLAATSLIPLVLFPYLGVLNEEQIADSYANHLVLLFLSGFMLSRAMEHNGAHRRLALGIIRMIGCSGGRSLVLACMLASAFLGMWASNTVTVLILLPIVIAVIDQTKSRQLATPLLLGIAYAAAIGGISTPIGTPPNGILLAQADLLVGSGKLAAPVGFFDWMKVGLPIAVIMLPLAWLWLTRGIGPGRPLRIVPLGPWRPSEIRVSLMLGLTAVLWVTRSVPTGGWSELLGVPTIKDSSVGILAVVALFIIPSGDGDGRKLLDWEHALKIPWNILIVLGGGIAIGTALTATGLSRAIVENLHLLSGLSSLPLIIIVVLVASFLTEIISSNTAAATILLPLLSATAVAADIPPLLLMIPATMAVSCAFLLPVATPPNAIVFAVGEFSTFRMIIEGMGLKIIGCTVITVVCYLMLG